MSENVKCASIEREKLIPGVGSVCLAAHDRAMMPREGCLCQFISLLRQNQSPKLIFDARQNQSPKLIFDARQNQSPKLIFDARHTPLVRRPSGVR